MDNEFINRDLFRVGDTIRLYRYNIYKGTVSRALINKFIVSSIDLTECKVNEIKLNTLENKELLILQYDLNNIKRIALHSVNFLIDHRYSSVNIAELPLNKYRYVDFYHEVFYYRIDLNGNELSYQDFMR